MCSGALSLIHALIIVQWRPKASAQDNRSELLNELVTLLVLYCLLLFIRDVIQDSLMLEYIGMAIIGVSVLNFLINSLPLMLHFKLFISKLCKKCQVRKKRKEMLKKMQNRANFEQLYNEQLEVSTNYAAAVGNRRHQFKKKFEERNLFDPEIFRSIQDDVEQERRIANSIKKKESTDHRDLGELMEIKSTSLDHLE